MALTAGEPRRNPAVLSRFGVEAGSDAARAGQSEEMTAMPVLRLNESIASGAQVAGAQIWRIASWVLCRYRID